MKFSLGLVILGASFTGYTKSIEGGCFSDHLHESILINSLRSPLYHKLTNGRTDKIFKTLIRSERLSLFFARYFDFKARAYHKAGVPLFCDEFMPMNATSEFEFERRIIPSEEFGYFDWQSYQIRLNKAVKLRDIESIKSISMEAIKSLNDFPSYYCMTRHMFESIYRFAYYAPIQEEASLIHGLKSSMSLSIKAIKLQLRSIDTSYKIDQWSAPIQKEGIPILCAELPRLLDDLDL